MRRSVAVTAVVAALALCPAGLASIVPGVSIAGVRLGDGTAAVRAKLGSPPQTLHYPGDPAGHFQWGYSRGARGDIGISFDRNRVVRIFINSPLVRKGGPVLSERTTKGIGLGSAMSAVESAYPGKCYFPGKGSHAPPSCSWTAANTMMLFQSSGRLGLGRSVPVETIVLQSR
jgi:hypothetical protein